MILYKIIKEIIQGLRALIPLQQVGILHMVRETQDQTKRHGFYPVSQSALLFYCLNCISNQLCELLMFCRGQVHKITAMLRRDL